MEGPTEGDERGVHVKYIEGSLELVQIWVVDRNL